jgi:hypothetical protein
LEVDLAKAPIITGTVHSRGISTRIITIKVVLAWELVILGALTQDSRQDTIKVITVTSMTIAATTSDVVEAADEDTTGVTAVEVTSSLEATPTATTTTRTKDSFPSTDPTLKPKSSSRTDRTSRQMDNSLMTIRERGWLMGSRPPTLDIRTHPVRL